MDQILRQAVGDARQRPHAAWADHHSAGQERSAGYSGSEIHVMVITHLLGIRLITEKFLQLEAIEANSPIEFLFNNLNGRRAESQMDGAAGGQQHFQKPHAVGHAAGARHGHHQVASRHAIIRRKLQEPPTYAILSHRPEMHSPQRNAPIAIMPQWVCPKAGAGTGDARHGAGSPE